MENINFNYYSASSELCEIGKKYDTDKSSQRLNVTNTRHCHPYTLFYDGLFNTRKNEKLEIAELGILDGASLLMWQEYFSNSNIHGFEYSELLINKFKKEHNNERISLTKIDVTNKDSILNGFGNNKYDIIIEDTTHQFDDQIRVIENTYMNLKPGGILISEDVFKSYKETDYINKLAPILENFQDYYFVSLDHVNRNSTGWDNDKLFILVKNYNIQNKITIITPSYRIDNLLKLEKSINFDYVDEWIIVYDGSKLSENPNIFKNNDKIKEYLHSSKGISGNPQRNYGLTKISNLNTFLYYLDDDNIIHPQFYRLLNVLVKNKIYTFNQTNRLKGNNIKMGSIDTAMFLIDYSLCKNISWIPDQYGADGYYITDCYNLHKDKHIFIDNNLCYYNKLCLLN